MLKPVEFYMEAQNIGPFGHWVKSVPSEGGAYLMMIHNKSGHRSL